MKIAGWILFLLGTLMAAAFGARIPPDWLLFGVGITLSLGGVALLRIAARGAAKQASKGSTGIKDVAGLKAGFSALVAATREAGKAPTGEDLKQSIEDVLMARFLPLIEARLLLSANHGIEAYAMVMGPAAAGERSLNRAWCALVDGHEPEARAQVDKAILNLEAAVAAWPA